MMDQRYRPYYLPQVECPLEFFEKNIASENVGFEYINEYPENLKPIQKYVNKNKVNYFHSLIDNNESINPVFISSDYDILDGHNRSCAFKSRSDIDSIDVIKINLNTNDAIRVLNKIQDKYNFINGYDESKELVDFNETVEDYLINKDEKGLTDEELNEIINEIGTKYGDYAKNYFDKRFKKNGDYKISDEDENVSMNFDNVKVVPDHGHNEGSYMEEENYEDFEKASMNPKENIKVYSFKDIDWDKTYPFGIIVALNPVNTKAHKYCYDVSFDNVYDVKDSEYDTLYPHMKLAEDWYPKVDIKDGASKNGMTKENYCRKLINMKAKEMGYDAIQFFDKFMFIVS